MPTYEYACRSCSEHYEIVQSFMDEPPTTCGACGGPLRKVFSPVGIAFKGSGFYRNDSRTGSSGKGRDHDETATKAGETTSAANGAGSKGAGDGSGSKEASAAGSGSEGAGAKPPAGDSAKSGSSGSGSSGGSGSGSSGSQGSGPRDRRSGAKASSAAS